MRVFALAANGCECAGNSPIGGFLRSERVESTVQWLGAERARGVSLVSSPAPAGVDRGGELNIGFYTWRAIATY
mgnify:CR=1 FL=1